MSYCPHWNNFKVIFLETTIIRFHNWMRWPPYITSFLHSSLDMESIKTGNLDQILDQDLSLGCYATIMHWSLVHTFRSTSFCTRLLKILSLVLRWKYFSLSNWFWEMCLAYKKKSVMMKSRFDDFVIPEIPCYLSDPYLMHPKWTQKMKTNKWRPITIIWFIVFEIPRKVQRIFCKRIA